MTHFSKPIKYILFLFVFLILAGRPVLSDDTCIFSVTPDEVPPNIVFLLDNGAESEHVVWHDEYVNTTTVVPGGTITWDDTSVTTGFDNDQGYSLIVHGGTYYLVKILADLSADDYGNGLTSASNTTIDNVVWATFTVNGRTIRIPAKPSAVVDGDGVKDNSTIFRYTKNYLNWLFYGDYDGSDLPDKSRFYYAKKAIFTVAEQTQRLAYFGIYAFESTNKGASNVQPLGFVYDGGGTVDSNFVNNVNNLGTFNYSPLAEGLASVGGYYGSPSSGVVGVYCQKNFVIVITSGMPSKDQATAAGSSPGALADYDGDGEGVIPLDTGDVTIPTNIDADTYLDDVAYYLYNNDIVDYRDGFQNVLTYTIGFMGNPESNAYLINASNNGNGELNNYVTTSDKYGGYHLFAEDPSNLSEKVMAAVTAILSKTSSFTAPVVPVTRTTSGNRIYLAFFKPNDDPNSNFWEGNVTKFGLSTQGKIINADGMTESTWPNGAIKEDAVPYWETIDWADTSKANGVNYSARKIYTYLGVNSDLTNAVNSFSVANSASLLLSTYDDTTGPLELTSISGTFSAGDILVGQDSGATGKIASISGNEYTLLNDGDRTGSFRIGERVKSGANVGTIANAGTTELINFVRGADVKDEDEDGTTNENRSRIVGDPLHSEPVVVYYGDIDRDNDASTHIETTIVFFGANDGMLHAVNDIDGTEAWSFVPPDLLPELKNILEASTHQYYVDSTPAVYKKDNDDDGIIEPLDGDKVYLICGERKGGTSFFALDVTDPDVPKFLWRIADTAGTPAATTVIAELGESWSIPVVGTVKTSGADVDVVFIGGGYSSGNTSGRGIFAINVSTGAVVKEFKYDAAAADDTVHMAYSIPSKIFALDRELNGYIDKLYVGDTGGQVWRIGKFNPADFDDIDENIDNWEIHRLFTARCNESDCADTVDNDSDTLVDNNDVSKFFYPPTVTLEDEYDLVFIGSGDRDDPCNDDTYDTLYAIRDNHETDALVLPVEFADLVNAETDLIENPGYTAPDFSGGDLGWYLQMEQGDKALAESVVFNTILYQTTFLPNNELCVPGGYANLYALDYLTGAPALDFDNDGDTDSDDAKKIIGGGIPSKPVVVITETGIAKILISASSTNPDAASENTEAGVTSTDLVFPSVNFFLRWWRGLFD